MTAAVLFDLDGTLVDGEAAWAVAHQETAYAFGGHLTGAALAALAGVDVDTSVATIISATGRRWTPTLARKVRTRLVDEVAAVYTAGVTWIPGAEVAVDTVRAAGLPTALVTNTPRRLTDIVLHHIGVHRFDVVVCGDDVRAGKPSAEPYLRSAALLDVDPRRCVAVEDSPAGVLSARRAGAVVLVVPGVLPVPDGPGQIRCATPAEWPFQIRRTSGTDPQPPRLRAVRKVTAST